jgi:hypothetical protein
MTAEHPLPDLPLLERRILQAKGLDDGQIAALIEAGVTDRAAFATIGDAATLRQLLPALSPQTAEDVMAWAIGSGTTSTPAPGGSVVIESSDTVNCVHCGTRQPKDYSPGDLCSSCGKQAEPILACHWCGASGPGRFCRQCGAEYVATAELDLAILLKREGLPKEEIPRRLEAMSAADKDVLWGRVRKARG